MAERFQLFPKISVKEARERERQRERETERDRERQREREREREYLFLLLTGTPRTPSAGVAWLMTDTAGTNRSPCSCVTVPVSVLQWVTNSQRVHKG